MKNDSIYVLSRCEDNPAAALGGRTSRIGISVSEDGIHFTSLLNPFFIRQEMNFNNMIIPGGCEDPRIVQTDDGLYVLAYTSWNYKIPRLSIAFSKDLFHWEKKGPGICKSI